MEIEQTQDLLNTMAKEICPQFKIEFMCHRANPYIKVGYIWLQNYIAFDDLEIHKNNGKQLNRLFKRRLERSLMDTRKKILEDLRQLRSEM